MKMPYGKYRDHDISSIPDWYLRWIAENIDETKPRNQKLCLEADEELQYRIKNGIEIK